MLEYRCKECGGDNVWVNYIVMVNMNNGDKDEGQEVDGSEWCGSCMLEVEVEEVEVE